MKKFLSILGAMTLTASMAATVIACGTETSEDDTGPKYPANDLRSIFKVTDLGEIKNSEVTLTGGEFIEAALIKVKEKNPRVDQEIIDNKTTYDITKDLNIFRVDGFKASFRLFPAYGSKEFVGEVWFTFTLQSGTKPLLLDNSYLEHNDLGQIEFVKGTSQEEQEDQVLAEFFKQNPKFKDERFNFNLIRMQTNGSEGELRIKYESEEPAYDLRLGSELSIAFSPKEIEPKDLKEVFKVTDLELIKDSEVERGDYFQAAVNKLAEKNPDVDPEIIANLTSRPNDLEFGLENNKFIVNELNVSTTVFVKKNFKKVFGDVNITFTMESSDKPSLFDSYYLQKTNLGIIEIPKEADGPTKDQVLAAFFEQNPSFKEISDEQHFVAIINPSYKKTKAAIGIMTDKDFDLRLGMQIYVDYTVQEV